MQYGGGGGGGGLWGGGIHHVEPLRTDDTNNIKQRKTLNIFKT